MQDGPMTTTARQGGDDEQAFLDGSVRDALGLRHEDIEVGIEIAARAVKRGALAEALRAYGALALCEPNNADVQIGLANCAMLMEQFGLGAQAAAIAIALAPQDARGWLVSGRCRLGLGETDASRRDLSQAETVGLAARSAPIVEDARRLLKAVTP